MASNQDGQSGLQPLCQQRFIGLDSLRQDKAHNASMAPSGLYLLPGTSSFQSVGVLPMNREGDFGVYINGVLSE